MFLLQLQTMMIKYPTKEEIISAGKSHLIITGVIELVKDWKQKCWLKCSNKKAAIEQLHEHLHDLFQKHTNLIINPMAQKDCYIKANNTIYLTKPSIITYLHEFAHSLGADEDAACVFSYQLFKATFPRSLAKLKWKGHLLVS